MSTYVLIIPTAISYLYADPTLFPTFLPRNIIYIYKYIYIIELREYLKEGENVKYGLYIIYVCLLLLNISDVVRVALGAKKKLGIGIFTVRKMSKVE